MVDGRWRVRRAEVGGGGGGGCSGGEGGGRHDGRLLREELGGLREGMQWKIGSNSTSFSL